MSKKIRFIIAFVYFLFICWIIYLADDGSTNPCFQTVRAIRYSDKAVHFLMFGLLVFLVNYAYGFRSFKLSCIRVPFGSMPVLGFSVLEELSQFFFPARTPELDDAVFSILGIIFFSLIYEKG